ncbi:hypothetical protein ACFE33_03445 [Falsihalocynthiibacter sp. SS001]|uniref:hypothetical protein n=1 Tax=Falsihalocynthiibacter sp. SS001 TaxID=3349698 RepID=UPI0036D2CE44
MKTHKLIVLALFASTLTACGFKSDQSIEGFVEGRPIQDNIKWGIYVDPDGCDTWIADNGNEGYAVARLEPRTGARVCSGLLEPGTAAGHKQHSIWDPL